MKKTLLILFFAISFNQFVFSQIGLHDCNSLAEHLQKSLTEKINVLAGADKINNDQLASLGEWMIELKQQVQQNNFGLFAGTGLRPGYCDADIADIFRTFFNSNYQYIFEPGKYAVVDKCASTFDRLKQMSFALRAVFPLSDQNTLKAGQKEEYTAFYEYLYEGENERDPGIAIFFYDHMDDIKRATGFNPDPAGANQENFALQFIRDFRSHLKFYFGNAEEEFIKSVATNQLSQIRSAGGSEDLYRQSLRQNLLTALRVIETEFGKLKELCAARIDATSGLIKTITTTAVTFNAAKFPDKPTGEAGELKPGHGWVVIGVLDASGKIFREYGGTPPIGLSQVVNNQLKNISTIRASEYHQVPAGTYFANIGISGRPQRSITVEAGSEVRFVLRLGRLQFDLRNFDGTANSQTINLFTVNEKTQQNDEVPLTLSFVGYGIKPATVLDLAPGRYVLKSFYGFEHSDTITIEKQQLTKLTITGAANFTGPKEVPVKVSLVEANNKLKLITNLGKGQSIQLTPGLYEIYRPDNIYTYRQKMERGGSYTYKEQ